MHAHNPGNTTCYLNSASSHLPSSPAAQLGRLRADITSVAAPGRAALAQSEGKDGSSRQSLEGFTGSQCDMPEATAAGGVGGSGGEGTPGPLQDVDPRAVLRTQMQQLSKLSQMLSQQLHVSHHESAAAEDADDQWADESGTATVRTQVLSSDDQSRSHNRDAEEQGASDTATHTDKAEQEEQSSQHAGNAKFSGCIKFHFKLHMTVQCQAQNRAVWRVTIHSVQDRQYCCSAPFQAVLHAYTPHNCYCIEHSEMHCLWESSPECIRVRSVSMQMFSANNNPFRFLIMHRWLHSAYSDAGRAARVSRALASRAAVGGPVG